MKKLILLMTLPLYPMDIKEQEHNIKPSPAMSNDHFATVYGMNEDTIITIIKTPNDSKRGSHSTHNTHNARIDSDEDNSLLESRSLADAAIEARFNNEQLEKKDKKIQKKERARIAAASAVIASLITAAVTLTVHFTSCKG